MKVIIIGAGGHARVVYEILRHDRNVQIISFVDNVKKGLDENIMGVPVRGDHSIIPELISDEGVLGFIIAVGENNIRTNHFEKLVSYNLEPINAIHPSSHISHSAKLGKGIVVATSASIVTGARIDNNSIINTGVIIEHEDRIGKNVHIAPGTSVAGRVTIKDNAFIGIGSTITQNVVIGKNAIVGAGSVVLNDIPENAVAVGAPAKVKRINKNRDDK